MGDRRLDAVDTLVGQNIRIIRQDSGMSQTELGRKIDVTFQQVQKYENGTNRVGSGRLSRLHPLSGCPSRHSSRERTKPHTETRAVARRHAGRTLCSTIAASVLCRREHGPRRSLAELAEQLAANRAPARRGRAFSETRTRSGAAQYGRGPRLLARERGWLRDVPRAVRTIGLPKP